MLPPHLIPNEMVMNKQDKSNKLNSEQPIETSTSANSRVSLLLDKYREFLSLLKDDLKKCIENNMILSGDIIEIEEERNYYLDKLMSVNNFCGEKLQDASPNGKEILGEVVKILTHVPEDFK